MTLGTPLVAITRVWPNLPGFDLEKKGPGTGHCYAKSQSLIAAQCLDWIQGCGSARWHVTSGQGGRKNNRA
jgi:hypothetical protein